MYSAAAVEWERASPDALVVTRADGVVLHWNEGAAALYGWSAEAALGRDLASLIAPAGQREALQEWLSRASCNGGDTVEAIRQRSDGALLYVDVTARVLPQPDGSTVLLLAEKDVTRLKVERDARAMEGRLRAFLESMPDGIVMADLTGHIVLANSQAERLFGYSPGELRGGAVEDLLPARFRGAHVGHRSDYFRQPRTRAMGSGLDLWGLRRDGSEFPIEISLAPLHGEAGSFVLSAIRDISERKRIEQALKEKNDELARASEAKDRFLASMSHELRTPLNAIIGFTGTLLMQLPGPLNEEQEQQLRTVQGSGRHLLSLINDLLDVARIAAGRTDLRLAEVDLLRAADEVVRTLQPQTVDKGLRLSLRSPLATAVARTDARLLRQILLNLVANAVKFTDSGEISLTLQHDDSPAAGQAGDFVIVVRDTGPGISPEDQARLFAPFSRLQAGRGAVSPEAVKEGSGLGLHLSAQLAQVLGGRIAVRSELGQGSTFSLHLPRQGPSS